MDEAPELSTSQLTAFGIELWTRYSVAIEMAEMLRFAERVASAGLKNFVDKVFYDSKSGYAHIELLDVEPNDQIDRALYKIAQRTLHLFYWHGYSDEGPERDERI